MFAVRTGVLAGLSAFLLTAAQPALAQQVATSPRKASEDSSKVALEAYEAGVKAYEAGKLGPAITSLSTALSSGGLPPPQMAKAFYYRGVAHRIRGNSTQAISDLASAIWLKGGLSDADRAAAIGQRQAAYREAGLGDRAAPVAAAVSSVAPMPPTSPAPSPVVAAAPSTWSAQPLQGAAAPSSPAEPSPPSLASSAAVAPFYWSAQPLPAAPSAPTPPAASLPTSVAVAAMAAKPTLPAEPSAPKPPEQISQAEKQAEPQANAAAPISNAVQVTSSFFAGLFSGSSVTSGSSSPVETGAVSAGPAGSAPDWHGQTSVVASASNTSPGAPAIPSVPVTNPAPFSTATEVSSAPATPVTTSAPIAAWNVQTSKSEAAPAYRQAPAAAAVTPVVPAWTPRELKPTPVVLAQTGTSTANTPEPEPLAAGNAGQSIGSFFGGNVAGTHAPSPPTSVAAIPAASPVTGTATAAVAGLPAASTPSAGSYRLQVAALATRAEAEQAAQTFQSKHGASLRGATPEVDTGTDGSIFGGMGTVYRVTVGPYASAAEPGRLCNILRPQGYDCQVTTR